MWRARIGDALRPILAAFLERAEPPDDEEREIIGSFISTLAGLADSDAKPIIEALFAADRVLKPKKGDGPLDNIPIIDREGVKELYAEGGDPPRDPLPHTPLVERYRKQYQEHLESERQRKRLAVFEEPELPPQPYVSGRRLGRNDPCWCGSDKKYKKCHLAQDEQARRMDF
ncbi:MAG: SEC-C metal-binding domain-containing protein [Armatimonadota bacterium]|nr:SEC-C metal-binding domain-containing protein [Armatimonadota bacterium]